MVSTATWISTAPDLQYFYPDFTPAEVPSGTSARRAWIGRIQPFTDDASARLAWRRMQRDLAISIDRGTILPPQSARKLDPHPLESLAVNTEMSFEVLLLEFDNPQHPWVYCVAPEVSRDVFPALLHIREDRSIWFRGRYIPGLCVYSASIFKFESWPSKSVQVLDQTATYLGKLVIWLRTRRLFHLNSGVVLYTPAPGEQVRDTEPRINRNFPGIAKQLLPITRAWRGVWPGGVAPFGPAGHFQTIAPQEECWCGSGETYGNCHRRQEASVLGNTGDGTSPN